MSKNSQNTVHKSLFDTIIITQLPTKGTLYLFNEPITTPYQFPASYTSHLTYQLNTSTYACTMDNFKYIRKSFDSRVLSKEAIICFILYLFSFFCFIGFMFTSFTSFTSFFSAFTFFLFGFFFIFKFWRS